MEKLDIILIAFFVVTAVRGRDFHGDRPKEIIYTGERQSQLPICPNENYILPFQSTTRQDQTGEMFNYGCVLLCQVSDNPNDGLGLTKQQGFYACGTNGQCLSGKCFDSTCLDWVRKIVTQGFGATLGNIKVFQTYNSSGWTLILLTKDNQFVSFYPYDSQCEMTDQYSYFAEDNDGGNNGLNSQSDVIFNHVVQPADKCASRFDSRHSGAITWNNKCYFRCVVNNQVSETRFIQPSGKNCGPNYSCLYSKCQNNICIDLCNSISKATLTDIIQISNGSDEVFCDFKGKLTLDTVKLPYPLKCEANYTDPANEDSNANGSNGTTGKSSGTFNAGGVNNFMNFGNSTSNQAVVNNNQQQGYNPNQSVGK